MDSSITVVAMSSNQSAWWLTLVIGLVVLLVVLGLLEALRRTVVSLDGHIWTTWVSGKEVVRHSATTYLLTNTRTSGEELVDELGYHGR